MIHRSVAAFVFVSNPPVEQTRLNLPVGALLQGSNQSNTFARPHYIADTRTHTHARNQSQQVKTPAFACVGVCVLHVARLRQLDHPSVSVT